jgi:hypothetical protein
MGQSRVYPIPSLDRLSHMTAGLESEHGRWTAGWRLTIGIALVAAALSAGLVLTRGTSSPTASDFDQLWHGARAALRGVSPYQVVGPGREFDWDYLFYPMPAIVLALPFGLVPLLVARTLFAALGGGLLAAAFARNDLAKLLTLVTAPTLIALGRGQSSPLLLAAAFFPALAWVGAAKPNIAVSLLPASVHIRRTIIAGAIGAIVLTVISFALEPTWVAQWREVVGRKTDNAPAVFRFGGFLIPVVLLRWRRREAWLIMLLACVPQTPSLYDAVPLFAVPVGLRQCLLSGVSANVAFLALVTGLGFAADATYGTRVTTLSVLFMYLPAVALVLSRPNDVAPAAPATKLTRLDLPLAGVFLVTAFFTVWGTVAKYL